LAIESTTVLPKPRRFGADTDGPSRSVKLIMKVFARKPPAYVDPAGVHRQRAVFAGIGCQLMEREADRLCTSSFQAQLRAVHSDPRPYKVRKMRELGADQLINIDPLPFITDQQVLIGCERPDAFIKAGR
jgi:hypothetical protein